MSHDSFFRFVADQIEQIPIPASGLSAEIIAALSFVAAAFVTGYFATRGNRRPRRRADHDPTGAERDAAEMENDLRDARRTIVVLESRVAAQSRFLWIRRYDPNMIVHGTETDDIVKRPD